MSTVLEYPEDLNPFADEFDEKSDEKSDERSDKKSDERSDKRSDEKSEKYPETFNPFDEDDNANELDANKNEIITKLLSISHASKYRFDKKNLIPDQTKTRCICW